MKKFLLMMAMAGAFAAVAENVLLQEFNLGAGKDRYCYGAKEQVVKQTFGDGVYTIEIVRNASEPKNVSNIQFWTIYNGGFRTNGKYRAELTIESSRDIKLRSAVMLNKAPYRALAQKEITLKAGEPAELVIDFTAKQVLQDPYRTPCIFLGGAEVGAVFKISKAKLYEVK